MKDYFTITLIVLLMFSVVRGCNSRNTRRIIGDDYIVTEVMYDHNDYNLKYCVKATSTNEHKNIYTFTDNCVTYYTDQLYTVGDTIRLVNSKDLKLWDSHTDNYMLPTQEMNLEK